MRQFSILCTNILSMVINFQLETRYILQNLGFRTYYINMLSQIWIFYGLLQICNLLFLCFCFSPFPREIILKEYLSKTLGKALHNKILKSQRNKIGPKLVQVQEFENRKLLNFSAILYVSKTCIVFCFKNTSNLQKAFHLIVFLFSWSFDPDDEFISCKILSTKVYFK